MTDFVNESKSTFKNDEDSDGTESTSSMKLSDYPTLSGWDDIEDGDMNVLRGIYSYGFEKPSPIQQKAIPPMIDRRDMIAQAQSGTGKTGAFTVGTLNIIDTSKKTTQAIVMAPTRELAMQISNVFKNIGTFLENYKVQLLVGGNSVDEDIKKLKDKDGPPHVVVGTPGRIHDMIRRNHVNVKNIRVLTLDEADEMLSTGFKDQVYNIFQYMPKNIQLCLYSATVPNEIAELSKKFMRDPVRILVKSEMLTLEGISQFHINIEDDQGKYLTLKDLYESLSVSQCIIYCNSVKRVQDLYQALLEDGFPVAAIHSSMDKQERTESYKDFKSGKSRVLVSSNVTARGIDVQQVSIVINFDVPKCVHTYLHRIGRSGRWGRKGIGINFVTKRDFRYIKAIEQHYSTQITELPSNYRDIISG
jgi:translation initiation factor 4A